MKNPEAGPRPGSTERPLVDALEAGEFKGGEAETIRLIVDAFGDKTMLVEGEDDASDRIVVDLE